MRLYVRYVLQGGAGYIGSHAALALLRQGYKVTVVDNLSRGNYGAIAILMKMAAPNQLAFVKLDLGHQAKVAWAPSHLFQHNSRHCPLPTGFPCAATAAS